MRNIKYALKSKTNPLKLDKQQRKSITEKIKNVSGKNGINKHSKPLKKYKNRNLPTFPVNENCNKKMKGNDGNMYISQANKNNICSWKKI